MTDSVGRWLRTERELRQISLPELAQTTTRGLHFYVGKRWVRDRGLVHSVILGYGELVPRGRYPNAVVFIELDGSEVDVNVHPQKLEVRFSDPQAVYAAVRHAVRNAIARAPWLGEGGRTWAALGAVAEQRPWSGGRASEAARRGGVALRCEGEARQCGRVRANAARHGVALEIVHGDAPAALRGLPDPDAVFIGGGGTNVVLAAAERARRVVVTALTAVERVGPVRRALVDDGWNVDAPLLSAARLAPPNGHRLDAQDLAPAGRQLALDGVAGKGRPSRFRRLGGGRQRSPIDLAAG